RLGVVVSYVAGAGTAPVGAARSVVAATRYLHDVIRFGQCRAVAREHRAYVTTHRRGGPAGWQGIDMDAESLFSSLLFRLFGFSGVEHVDRVALHLAAIGRLGGWPGLVAIALLA